MHDQLIIALAQSAGFAFQGAIDSLGLLFALAATGLSVRAIRAVSGDDAVYAAWQERSAGLRLVLLIGCAGFVVGLLAWLRGADGTFAAADHAFSAAAHRQAPASILWALSWISRLGDGAVLAVFSALMAGILAARREFVLAIGLCAAAAINGLVNGGLKRLFALPRPVPVDGLAQAYHGYGFPSGHASGALVFYGMAAFVLLCLLPRRWRAAVVAWAACIVLLVASSRVILGAHFMSDVVGGLASGSIWLAVAISWVLRRRRPT